MKKLFALWLLFWLAVCVIVGLTSCKTAALPACKHQTTIPEVVQVDSTTFYTIQVPFCDTVLVTKKIKQ